MMRDFDMRGHGRGFGGGHSMIKPVLIGVALIAVLSLLVMSLWNALLPVVFGVKSIGFWQALGMLVLCRILFGGLGLRPGMFGMARDHRRMHERWMQMTPEQREQFVQQRRGGFGRRGHHHGHHHGERHGEHHGDPRERRGEGGCCRQQPEENAQKPTETQ